MARPKPAAAAMPDRTEFFGSQVGGQDVVTHSYTDFPTKLLLADIASFFRNLRYFFHIFLPASPCDSGDLDELAVTWQNGFCVAIHVVLFVLQLMLLMFIPVAIFLPVWADIIILSAFSLVNWALARLLNGGADIYHSDDAYAEDRPEHANEAWIFLNGVAVG